MQKKRTLQLLLNNIQESDDPTELPCTFIILDFEKSHNNAVISKEVALEAASTIINKPIVAKYNEVDSAGSNTDSFGGHEVYIGENKYGELEIKMGTVPIGVFTTEGYVMTINTPDGEKEVLAADAVLWKSRFSDACDLLLEWYNRGININTSCELLYYNFSFIDGVEYIQSPIYFEGHAILNSEERGGQDVVLPAYDSSKLLSFNEIKKFNKLVSQAINQEQFSKQQNNNEEGEKMEKFKKVFELSYDDIRSLLYTKLDDTLGENEYSWIADVYDTYFVANIYSYTEGNEYDKYFKFNYVKTDDSVTIDFDSKKEVFLKRNWEEVIEEEIQSQLNEKDTKISELQSQLNAISAQKDEIEVKFNETTEKLTQLNSMVEELKPYKEQVKKENFEKALNEKKEFYSKKFSALKADEKFKSEEVQELIKKAVYDNEEGKNAILQLNTLLVELVEIQETSNNETPAIRETASKRENLIPEANDFDSRYSL